MTITRKTKGDGAPIRQTPRNAPPRIIRVPVHHRAVFRSLLSDAVKGASCFRHHGNYWRPIHKGRQFALYRRAPDYLFAIREKVRDYEFSFYHELLRGRCGRDGVLRPRTCLWQRHGTYRAAIGADGDLP